MTTIAVVKKSGFVAIGADTQTTLGSRKESANYVKNNKKIIKHHESFLAVTGWGTFQLCLQDLLERFGRKLSFESISDIFKSSQMIQREMKENYFLKPDSDD